MEVFLETMLYKSTFYLLTYLLGVVWDDSGALATLRKRELKKDEDDLVENLEAYNKVSYSNQA